MQRYALRVMRLSGWNRAELLHKAMRARVRPPMDQSQRARWQGEQRETKGMKAHEAPYEVGKQKTPAGVISDGATSGSGGPHENDI